MGEFRKAAVISDLHLGEKDSFLHASSTKTVQANQNLNTLRDLLREEGPFDELIILGDFLDLSLAPFYDAVLDGKHFFRRILDGTEITEIYFVPGNHDHHLWIEVVERKEVVEKIEDGGFPVGQPDFINRFVDKRFTETHLSGLLPDGADNPHLIVKYPHHLRRCGESWYLFFHGHFLEQAFTPLNIILKPGRLAELEAFNTLWLEALWYHVGQAGPLSDRVEEIYKSFKRGDKEEMNRFINEIALALKRRLEAPWYVNLGIDVFKWFVKVVLKHFYKPTRGAGLAGRELDKHQRERIADYIQRYVLQRYTIELGFEKSMPSPFTFVYGHTHRPHLGHQLTINDEIYPLANTGGWLRSDGDDGSTAGILIIDEAGPRWMSLKGRIS
jgi:UDP-2,3-diacylglucosamine pyrophosphatase LpxH